MEQVFVSSSVRVVLIEWVALTRQVVRGVDS